MKNPLIALIAGLLLLIASCNSSVQKNPETNSKPNILFIITDQHNATALSCYGNEEISTPNMDRLAREGLLFENAICQTGQCVPSRYSIWTGRYARSTGTYWNGQGQNPDENTVGDLFKKAGYVTGTIGKHHQIMNAENKNHGFDTVLVPRVNLMPVDTLPYAEVHPGRSRVGTSSLSNDEHTCGLITQASLDFIRANKEKPFVLWCSYFGPHTPINPSVPWANQYDAESITMPPNHQSVDWEAPGMEGLVSKSGPYSNPDYHKKSLALYYGFVSQIDYNIGRMIKELEELGLLEKTIVVYTADHGEMMSEHQSWTKGLTGYDATIRVPLIIRDATTFTDGQRTDKLAGSIDLLPTLLDLAGLDVPDNIQGESLRPSKLEKENWRNYIFNEIGRDLDNNVVTVRSQTHKYVHFRKDGQTTYEQFFDLEEDRWEMTNLVDDPSYAPMISKFREEFQQWEKETEKSPPILISQNQ